MAQKDFRQVAQERSNNNNNTQHHRMKKKSSSNTVAAFQDSDLIASLLYKPFGDVGAKLDLHWKQLVDILSGSTSNNNTEKNVSSGRQIASQSCLLTKVAATIVRCRQQLHGTTQQAENNNKKLLGDVLQGSVSSSPTVMSMAAKKRFSKAIGHIVDGDNEAFIEELIAGVLKEAPLLTTSDFCGASSSTFSSFAPVGLHYLHAQLLCAAAGSKSELGTKKKMQISNLLSEHCIGTALSVGVSTVSDDQQDDDESTAASCWVFSTTDTMAQKKLLLELFRFHVSFILESKLEDNIEADVRKGYLEKYNATMLQVASGGDVAFVKAVEAMVEQSCDSYLMQEGQCPTGSSSALSTSSSGENNEACSVAKIPRYATAAANKTSGNDAAASFSSPVHNKTNDFVKEASSSSATTKSTSTVGRRSYTALDKLRSLLLGGETITSLRGLTIIGVVLLIVTLLVRYYYLRRGGGGSSTAPPAVAVGHRGGVSSSQKAAMNSRRALSL